MSMVASAISQGIRIKMQPVFGPIFLDRVPEIQYGIRQPPTGRIDSESVSGRLRKQQIFQQKDSKMQTAEQMRSDIVNKAGTDPEFRARLVSAPKDAVREVVGSALPEGLDISVHEETSHSVHLVLPVGNRLSKSQLEAVAASRGGQLPSYW